ncbi:hypothetical protein HHI36_002705 [Cryptolaemus montrouzieri]|uniref:Uncharacterized protein n=1 Tax=Cryptolaemus montrouzieri TaxID=559131 RepID=A0ABD2PBB3_9CUCU
MMFMFTNTTAQKAASNVHTAFMGMVEKCCPLKKRMTKKTEIKVESSAALVKIKQLDILATDVSVTEEEGRYHAYKRKEKLLLSEIVGGNTNMEGGKAK